MDVIQTPGVVQDWGLESVHLDRVAGQPLGALHEAALELVVELSDPAGADLLIVASRELVDLVLELLKTLTKKEKKGERISLGLGKLGSLDRAKISSFLMSKKRWTLFPNHGKTYCGQINSCPI